MNPRIFALLLLLPVGLLACGESEEDTDSNNCTPSNYCADKELSVPDACADCRTIDDGCGGQLFCAPDPTCTNACPSGMYQEYGDCEDCMETTACGKQVLCRDQAICLQEATCPDGGLLLEQCPPNSQNCLPHQVCGESKYCPTLQQCQRVACDPGEAPTILTCAEAATDLPCREIAACGATVTCVCNAATLVCDPDETFDTNPCTPGQECREVQGCGETFYCKGDSI